MKVDISKTFDTLNFSFLLKVLKKFGFNKTFYKYIECILQYTNVSISNNGGLHGYFKCQRRVRQEEPLFPLLFCIVEDVISRGLSKLVSNNKIKLTKSYRSMMIPSHALYDDDTIIFIK